MGGGTMNSIQFSMYSAITSALQSLNGYYASTAMEINRIASSEVLKNADELTGNSLERSALDGLLETNRQYRQNINEGESIIQTTDSRAYEIQKRLETMEYLAVQAASGEYSQVEVEEFQTQFETLMSEIDTIAIQTRPGGFFMLSFTSDEMVGVDAGNEDKILIHSRDMTTAAMGLIDNMDLVNAPEDALATVQQAQTDVETYRGQLADSEALLSEANLTLGDEWTQLTASRIQVDSSVSAWQALESILGMMESGTALTLAVQANVTADEAIKYLIDSL